MKKILLMIIIIIFVFIFFLYKFPHVFLKLFGYTINRKSDKTFQAVENSFSEEALKKNIAKYPNNEDFLLSLGNFYIGEAMSAKACGLSDETGQSLSKAKATFFKVLSMYPDSMVAHKGLGKVYFLEDDYVKCLSEYTDVLEKKSSDFEALYYFGVCYNSLDQKQLSVEFLQRAKIVAQENEDCKKSYEYKMLLNLLKE
ncbi:MAG: hypothetical protein ABIC68_02910 [Candidatus Omnitrophota bacterium]